MFYIYVIVLVRITLHLMIEKAVKSEKICDINQPDL